MDINRNNYETYFLDFLEGRLSAGEEEVLRRFLKFNPDLAEEIENISIYPLEPGNEKFPDRELLYRRFPDADERIDEENFEMFCIAYLEGDLNTKQVSDFEDFIESNTKYRKELEYFRASYLKEERIKYPAKRALKKQRSIQIEWQILAPLAAAAAILLMVLIRPAQKADTEQIAGTAISEEENVIPEEVAEVKKPPAEIAPAAIQLIRSSKTSAPVPNKRDTQKELTGDKKNENNKEKNVSPERKETGIKLGKTYIAEVQTRYDRIVPEAVAAPEIHYRSLSVIDMARYQYQKASKVLEDDEPVFWNLASRGIEELNKISGPNTELLASRDEDGSISGIHLKTKFLSFTAPLPSGSE